MDVATQQDFDYRILGAAMQNKPSEIERLLGAHAEFAKVGDVLAEAIDSPANCSTIQLLLDLGWSPNSRSSDFDEPVISVAAGCGRGDVVRLLVARGADVNARSQLGSNAVCAAAIKSSALHADALQFLIECEADVNAGVGRSPLMMSINEGTELMTDALLAAGADPRRWYRAGNALLDAVVENKPRAVRRLVEAGADPDERIPPEADIAFKNFGSVSPREVAVRMKRQKILEAFAGGGEPVAKPSTETPVRTWKRIEKRLRDGDEELALVLNEGATEAGLAAVEAVLNRSLPKDVRESWLRHDGMTADHAMFRVGDVSELDDDSVLFRLLPVAEWSEEVERFRESAPQVDPDGALFRGEPGVAAVYWSGSWLPLARNLEGDYLFCDLEPPPGGIFGQIILASSEDPIRRRIADSWGSCLAQMKLGLAEDEE